MSDGSAEEQGWWRAALDLVLPRTCPGCGAPGSLCTICARGLAGPFRRIALGVEALDAAAGLPLPAVRALARYRGPVRAAIVAGKERGRWDLPPLLGAAVGDGAVRLLHAGLLHLPLWFVPAPTRRVAARRRGGDPVTALAKAAARVVAGRAGPAGVAVCLATVGRAADSVGLTPTQRLANLDGRIRFHLAGAPPEQACVVLLDDVVTTGATAVSAVRVLAGAGIVVHTVLAVAGAGARTGDGIPPEARGGLVP